jgi:hypothetical protein
MTQGFLGNEEIQKKHEKTTKSQRGLMHWENGEASL